MSAESVLARIAENPDLPTPPALTLRVLERANRPNCSIADLATLVSHDPALCGRMLRLVNSSLYGLQRPVTSIDRALNLLGLNHVRSLVLSLSLPSLRFQRASSEQVTAYWKNSVTIAIVCRELAIHLKWPDADSEMVAGLLCDFGILLLQDAYPIESARVASAAPGVQSERQCELEVEHIGVDHAEAGAFLLKRWRLPEDLTEAIRFHHRPSEAPKAHADRATALYFASQIARLHQPINHSGLLGEILRVGHERYRLDQNRLLDFLESLNAKIREFASLIDIDLGPRESFAELFAKATENLTRLATEASLDNFRIHEEKSLVERHLRDAKEALRLSEQQLWHAQKIDAIGQLAAGIAHDFNNLLTVINGSSELLLNMFSPKSQLCKDGLYAEASELIEMTHESGKRAADLTQQLLAFGRKQRFVSEVLSLNSIILAMTNLLRRLLGAEIQLLTRLADDSLPVKVDRGQIEQVIMNLAVNARDAMPGGGSLTLETMSLDVSPDFAAQDAEIVPGEYAVLTVRDTGHGMDEATQKKIFEPYFTTKEPGKGTGLGLATVHGIVRQSGGQITVSSLLGAGTVIHVYLPVVREPILPIKQDPPVNDDLRGSETILLVENEDPVREYTRRVLCHHGYNVLTASDGLEALRVNDRNVDAIHLLISDRMMPRMTGPELIRQMAERRPDLKVILTSGFAPNDLDSNDSNVSVAFLQKPYSVSALTSLIRAMLNDLPCDRPSSTAVLEVIR